MQLSSLAPALRDQQSRQLQPRNNPPATMPMPSAVKDSFQKTLTQKAPQFGGHCGSKQVVDDNLEVDIDERDEDGETAIARAVMRGNHREIEELVKAGADVSIANNIGNTPLNHAVFNGDIIGASIVLQGTNANINQRNPNTGVTALILAAMLGNADMVEFLVQKGADKTITTQAGLTAQDWATRNYTKIMKLLQPQQQYQTSAAAPANQTPDEQQSAPARKHVKFNIPDGGNLQTRRPSASPIVVFNSTPTH